MSATAQSRATTAYRQRLRARGLGRVELRASDTDKALLRRLAATLATDDARAQRLRQTLSAELAPPGPAGGGILAALLRAPRVDLDITREFVVPRDIDL